MKDMSAHGKRERKKVRDPVWTEVCGFGTIRCWK